MTAGALENGYSHRHLAGLLLGLRVGNRVFKNYESGAYGYIGFHKALEVSCNTFFYRIGFDFWQKYGSDVADVDAKDPLVEEAQAFGFGTPPASTSRARPPAASPTGSGSSTTTSP